MISTLTVIIPTFNNIFGLKYLLNYFKDKPYQVIIIDNGPSREKQGLVRKFESLKVLKYLPQKKNLGFAAAVNLGAKYAKTKWLLILNDDVEFKDDQLINRLYMEAEKRKVESLSPTLKNPNGEVENYGYKILPYGKVELIKNPKSLPVDATRQALQAGEILNPKQIPNSKFQILNSNIDGLTAACLLIKTDVFRKLKGFDKSFFAYLEDVDFFLRLSASWRIAQDKSFGIAYDIEVLHNHMTTTKTMGSFKARQDMINWWRLYFKHKERFKFDWRFLLERLKNLGGVIKSWIIIW